MKLIIKEAGKHGLCSCPVNRTNGCKIKFKWDGSKIKDITTISDKKLKLLYKVCNSTKIKGGLSECYFPIVKGL